ncbi:MAG: hypothetical protein GY942_08710, partial [Aestuariibacter sp.]|nr:hypothetical protein [Aestuariibacter sp.]
PLRSVYKITKSTKEKSGAGAIEDEKTIYYDELNRKIRTQNRTMDGRFTIKETYYNAKGLVEKANRPYLSYSTPIWVCFEYDDLGRLIEENTPGANGGSPDCNGGNRAVSTIDYVNGLTRTTTDALGRKRTEVRNVMDKVVSVVEAVGKDEQSDLSFTYDAVQNLRTTTDANAKVTTLNYDNSGRKIKMKDPSMGTWQYAYNSFGELEWQKDAKGQVVTMQYDLLGRMEQRSDDEGVWGWEYGSVGDTNAVGKLLKETGPNSYERSYSYNTNLQLSSSTLKQTINSNGLNQQETLTSSYTYDGYGRALTTTQPGGFVTENEYNRYGHLVAVKSPEDTLSTEAIAKLQAQKTELETQAAEAEAQATSYLNQAISYQSTAVYYENYALSLLRLEAVSSSSSSTSKALYDAANKLRDISLALTNQAKTAQNDALTSAA